MKLSELFPEMPIVKVAGAEYKVIFNTRAMMQLECEYPDKIEDGIEVTTQNQVSKIINSAVTGMKAPDIIAMLFAGLLHTKAFTSKEALLDATLPRDWSNYVDSIVIAYMNSSLTEEQIEKLQVLAADGTSKKKESGTLPLTTPSIESSAG